MLLDSLIRWNRWGSNPLSSGLKRKVTPSILPFLDTNEVVVLAGPRRAGKSTVMYQLMDELEKQGVKEKAILHINLEEPSFADQMNLGLLDELYQAYRAEVYPEGRAYIFLDEIQNIPGWERWVRARNKTEDIKIFITGSSSQLLSGELATLLTGRHVTFQIFPLSFVEYLEFKNIKPAKTPLPFTPPAPIHHALNQYIKWGGFPEVVLSEDESRSEMLLFQYFDDLLYKDIAMRHSVRDIETLRALSQHLLTHTGALMSYKRLANQFQTSVDLVRAYCGYLQDAFLIRLTPFYSLKVSERQRNPNKIHAVDLGLQKRVALAHSEDIGKRIETLVHNHLLQKPNDGVFYWKNKGEIDLVVRKDRSISQVIQVAYEGLDDKNVINRELGGLLNAQTFFPKAQANLIVWQKPKDIKIFEDNAVRLAPLWQFLLS